MKKLVIAVIFYNEINNVHKTLNQIRERETDFILIDDGSDDGTLDIIKKENYNLVSHEKNEGYGRAVKTAANYAKINNYDYFAIFPGDNQRKFEDIDKLYQKINSSISYDIIVGSKFRMLKSIPIKRKFGNYFFRNYQKFGAIR